MRESVRGQSLPSLFLCYCAGWGEGAWGRGVHRLERAGKGLPPGGQRADQRKEHTSSHAKRQSLVFLWETQSNISNPPPTTTTTNTQKKDIHSYSKKAKKVCHKGHLLSGICVTFSLPKRIFYIDNLNLNQRCVQIR